MDDQGGEVCDALAILICGATFAQNEFERTVFFVVDVGQVCFEGDHITGAD
jgi:hypothetical protein